ncbi:hypothetical protein [Microlunatus phosphovorus]|nr:hypothetical protein [Microlunatus phosphovorus]
MFEDRLEAALGDRRALADLAARAEQQSKRWGCRKLVVAAAWADAHSEVDHLEGGVLVERLVRIGPVGTPPVAEFAPEGLIGPYGTSTASARSWMSDALTVRHRLPRLWERVQAGEIHAWQARKVANLTAHLSIAIVGMVDEQTAGWVTQLPWQRFLKALDATMLEVDEKSYREREKVIAAKKEVRATQSEDGLRTLIARGEAGDVAMLLALHQRVAECLADEGDEDPLQVRMSKAMGWIAHPARVLDLLARHATDPDPHREPWEQVAAYAADDTDPWADDLPAAGWETAQHGNYHQPSFGEDEWWTQPRPDQPGPGDGGEPDYWPTDPPPDPNDLAWFQHQHDGTSDGDASRDSASRDSASRDSAGRDSASDDTPAVDQPSSGADSGQADPRRSDRGPGDTGPNNAGQSDPDSNDTPPTGGHRPSTKQTSRDWTGATTAGDQNTTGHDNPRRSDPDDPDTSDTDPTGPARTGPVRPPLPEAFRPPGWRPLTRTELAASAPTVVLHVHLSEQTLRDGHGVVRTDWGPILIEQLQRFLVQHEAHLTVYPVIDPAETAAADGYETPLRLRRAMQIRHPRSVFPHSPTTGRTDLDHTPAYLHNGPPGQTGMHTLGPLARCEHRAKTIGNWRSKQPEPGTYLWRSPEGWITITTNQGTLTLGHTTWATHLWETTG